MSRTSLLVAEVFEGDDYEGTALLEIECGRDFCDTCGDCLVCYFGDCCSGGCRFVVYIDQLTEMPCRKESENAARSFTPPPT